MDKNNLPPCPFCGSKAGLSVFLSSFRDDIYISYCSNPGCDAYSREEIRYSSEREAVAAWIKFVRDNHNCAEENPRIKERLGKFNALISRGIGIELQRYIKRRRHDDAIMIMDELLAMPDEELKAISERFDKD